MKTAFLKLSLVALLIIFLACRRSVSSPPITPPVITIAPTQEMVLVAATATAIRPTHTAVVPTPTASAPILAGLYAVVMLGEGDLLNVRAGPGKDSDVLETLGPEARNLQPTGKIEESGGVTWVEIQRSSGPPGWVSRSFLTEQVEPQAFCADERVERLMDKFVQAVKNQDGAALSGLVSPLQGLSIQHNWWNPIVRLDSPEALQNLFFSTTDYDWGIADGSGLPIVGPFKDLILPKLQDALNADFTRHCNVLESGTSAGGTTGMLKLPVEYANLNYVALFRAAPPDVEMDWRTWVVVIEYVDGAPYIVALVQYAWEI